MTFKFPFRARRLDWLGRLGGLWGLGRGYGDAAPFKRCAHYLAWILGRRQVSACGMKSPKSPESTRTHPSGRGLQDGPGNNARLLDSGRGIEKEGKQAVKMTRLSCHRFRSNEVRLWLSLIAYNLGNLWRRLMLPRSVAHWSLTSLQQRLVKTGGRLVKHARYYWLLLAESI
jgi:DDE family transposase